MSRIILLVDFDYYYAQVEEVEHPEYKDKPLVVCVYSGRSEDSGAVATANYKARELGIRAGIPIVFAKKKADEETTFIPMRKPYYIQLSDKMMDEMRKFSDKFEQVSVDEAYLDVTEKIGCDYQEAAKLGRELKQKIKKKFKLTCSIGIGPNKLIAKMSAGINKPDGMTITKKEDFKKTFHGMKVSKLHGIGPKIQEVLEQNGVKTIGDLASFDLEILRQLIGENKGKLLHDRANGIDDDSVEERVKQQLSRLKTLKEDTRDIEKIKPIFYELSIDVKKAADNRKVKFKTISTITINSAIQTKTRSRTLEEPENTLETIEKVGIELLEELLKENPDEKIRRIGVGISNFIELNKNVEKKKNQSGLDKFFKN